MDKQAFFTSQESRRVDVQAPYTTSDCTNEVVQHMQVKSGKELDVQWVKEDTSDKVSGVVALKLRERQIRCPVPKLRGRSRI